MILFCFLKSFPSIGGIRAAAFVSSPLIKKKKRVSKELLHVTDWYATILSLAGAKPDENTDGKNIWNHLSLNSKPPRKELLLNIDDMVYRNSALRDGKWKILFQERKSKSLQCCTNCKLQGPIYRTLPTGIKSSSSYEMGKFPMV